jgi:copper(I)-binding protein
VDGDSTSAFVTIENPTMYDAYLVSASSDVAGTIVFRRGGDAAATEVKDLVVPAFGSLEMTPEAGYLWLSNLKRTLFENESVEFQLTMDGNVAVPAKATVRK